MPYWKNRLGVEEPQANIIGIESHVRYEIENNSLSAYSYMRSMNTKSGTNDPRNDSVCTIYNGPGRVGNMVAYIGFDMASGPHIGFAPICVVC